MVEVFLCPIFAVIFLIVIKNAEGEMNLNFQQNDYKYKFERMELARYNKEYVTEMSMKTYKYNRSTPLMNGTVTFKIDVGNDLVGVVQAFLSNEYRTFPLRVGAHFCKILEADSGSTRLLQCGNFTDCPLLKNRRYEFCNFMPDASKLPPNIPNGDYKVEIQGTYFSKELFVLNLYATISRPIV